VDIVTTPHSPLITGNMKFTYTNVDAQGNDISRVFNYAYDVNPDTVQANIRSLAGFSQVEVFRTSLYGCGYSCTWTINFRGVRGSLSSFSISSVSLAGGSNTPTIVYSNLRAFSTNFLANPLDYQFVEVAGDKPAIKVTVNNVPALC